MHILPATPIGELPMATPVSPKDVIHVPGPAVGVGEGAGETGPGALATGSAKQRWAAQRRRERRQRRHALYRKGLRAMALAAWDISKEHNVGSLVRTAHAAAVQEVLLVGEREWNVEAARTAEMFTSIIHLPDAAALSQHLHTGDWNLVAVELDERAENLFSVEYPPRPCFLLGAELAGVPEELLAQAAVIVKIPQWGLIPSLNLAVAGSLVIYDYLAKLNAKGLLDRPTGGLADGPGVA